MAKEDPDDLSEAEAQWRSTMLDAWYQTRMEKDRTLLTLSAGGVAVLVTLLTTVGVAWWWTGILYAVAVIAFIVAIHAAICIFHYNADHIMEAAEDAAKAHESPLRTKLQRLDKRLERAFWIGVAFSIAVGVASATHSFHMERSMADKRNTETTIREVVPETGPGRAGSEQRSADGITSFAPKRPKPADTGSGSGDGGASETKK